MGRKNRSSKKVISGKFTNAGDLKNRFHANAKSRIAAGNKKHGDSGGSHNLQEDCEALAVFFNSDASVSDGVGEIKLSANETIFNQKKQFLINKIQGLIGQCQTSNYYSVAGLQRQLGDVQKLEAKHQKELLQLEQEARELESAYDENVKKANDPNTSPEDKTKFLILANQISEKAKRLKSKIKQNPLADLSRFSNLDDLTTLLGGNVPKNPPKPKTKPDGSGGSTPTPNPLEDPKDFFEQYKTQIFMAIALIGVLFYLYTQKDIERDEDAEEDKKFMRQMMLMKAMNVYLPEEENKKKMEKEEINKEPEKTPEEKYQEDASIFPDGDKNKNFYFSRSAVYKIHFPPALQENYEKAKEAEIDCTPDSDKKDNSALFYGAPGTGKTATIKNVCVKANKYPVVEIKGSALTPNKEDQESGLLPLKKFQYTITDQISNNALTHDPTKLRFLKDCLEGVDKDSRRRLSNPLDFSWTWGEFKKYAQEAELFIEKNPNAQYDPKQDEETDEEDDEVELKDIEIGEFLDGDLMNYGGKFINPRKPTVEKVLEVQFTNLINKIDEQLDDIISELTGAACVCVATGGLAAPAIVGLSAAAGFGGYLVGDKADKESAEREKILLQDQRYKDAKHEIDTQINNNNQTQDAINTIIGKINGNIQRQPHETDEYLRNQLIILNGQLDSGKRRISSLRNDVDKLRKELGGGGNLMSLLGLDKLSFTDKVMIIAAIVLLI
ncbi:1575_t:CDS:10 [Entrophospora sp. SA101]|nr:1575_t:CDS:10 [Entrophospora sp. SA101]